jgi:hypothetical protein
MTGVSLVNVTRHHPAKNPAADPSDRQRVPTRIERASTHEPDDADHLRPFVVRGRAGGLAALDKWPELRAVSIASLLDRVPTAPHSSTATGFFNSLNVEFLPIIAIASAYPVNLLLFC